MFELVLKKDKMVAERLDVTNRAKKNSNFTTLVIISYNNNFL